MAATALTRAMLFIEELRKIDPEMPAQYALTFLSIAQNEGASQTETLHRLGVTKSAIQRTVNRLASEAEGGKPGHGLIEVRVSPADARARLAYVTPKGRRLLQRLLHYMEG